MENIISTLMRPKRGFLSLVVYLINNRQEIIKRCVVIKLRVNY